MSLASVVYGIPLGTRPNVIVLLHIVAPLTSYKLSLQQSISHSLRVHKVLFVFWGPKALMVVSILTISQEPKSPYLMKICISNFSEIELKVGYCHSL